MKGYCCFCGEEYNNYGNDIRPLITERGNRCCDECNLSIVIPNRVKFLFTKIPYIYVIKDRATKHYYDVSVLPNSAVSFHSDYVKKFESFEEAERFVRYNNLENCDIIRIVSREDD